MLLPGRGEGRAYPRRCSEQHSETTGPREPQGALDDTSGRTAVRPARSFAGQLLRVGVAVSIGSRLWVHSCSRPGTARRCEPPPSPRVPALIARGCAAPLLRPGSPRPPERTHASGGLGVSRDGAARRKHSCASRPKTHSSLNKTVGDGGGSHRRSRAVSTAALRGVATNTPQTPAPVRVRSTQGKAQLPHAL